MNFNECRDTLVPMALPQTYRDVQLVLAAIAIL